MPSETAGFVGADLAAVSVWAVAVLAPTLTQAIARVATRIPHSVCGVFMIELSPGVLA